MTLVEEVQSQRLERYLKMAGDLRRQAERTDDPDIAAAYLDLARVWLKLAEDRHAPLAANSDSAPEGEERSFRGS